MTISVLGKAGLVDIKKSESEEIGSDITLAFALDRGYLECMKVMLVSMARNGILCNSPVAIYTDDEELFKDPLISLIADKKVVISGEKKDIIYSMSKNNVKRPERSVWNRGTFLKWSIFEPQMTERLLFLDVDMLVLGSLVNLIEEFEDKSLVTSPQFQKSLKEGDVNKNLSDMLVGNFDQKHKKRINSGVMLVKNDLLSNEFFQEITRYVSSRVAIHEQGHLSDFFSDKKELLGMAPSAFNFQESYLRLAKGDVYQDILNDISVLHYAGGVKPWSKDVDKIRDFPSIDVWHQYRLLSAEVLAYK